MNNNSEQIKNSLAVLQEVFSGMKNYRILGSVLVAAINTKPHRELHDIDLLIDQKIYDEVVGRFIKFGFRKITKHASGFTWDEFEKENHLTFGVLLKGSFKEDVFEYKANNYITLLVDNEYIKPTMYELYGKKILGIPLRSVYEGIKIASFNTKRRVDKEVVVEKIGNTLSEGLSLNQAFHVRIGNIEIPYLYTLFSQVYNIVGGVRLAFGKSYDTWN
ncbi:MAG TPA: hypothetical protein VLF20_01200 [Patescibacteria group bacterium]|nr:hypothetical protein [Patescibacteria group bacterium]